ncbi:MAG: M24 family metallopeptidase [Gemmatimonadota bacterium]
MSTTSTRRDFIRAMGTGLAAAGTAASALACAPPEDPAAAGASEGLLVPDPDHVEPAPVGYDRLPLSWHQARARDLKNRVERTGARAVVLGSDQNMVYYTGCFRGSGERSTWAVFRTDEEDTVYWYAPGIDRDLMASWWSTELETYFCYPHAQGGFPNRGAVVQGPPVDLFAWMLEGLRRRGLAGGTVATDWTLSQAQLATVRKVVPGTRFVDISGDCLAMQQIKTPEELALIQRAYRYFDRIHAFARDYILERGTDLTDFELGQALQAYGIELVLADVERDGRPHSAVGIEVTSNYVRAGVASAYPHPNQFFHQRIQRGQTVYVNTDIRLGGMGGECYRNYLIAPWTPGQERMWEVVAETIAIQEAESRTGAVCSDVAARIHQHQVDAGMAERIYHRPAHGQGQFFSGHQPPFIALGDDTVLEENMTFSMEPGLYDAVQGIGINPSDNLRVTAERGVRFSSVPFSKEWSFLTL